MSLHSFDLRKYKTTGVGSMFMTGNEKKNMTQIRKHVCTIYTYEFHPGHLYLKQKLSSDGLRKYYLRLIVYRGQFFNSLFLDRTNFVRTNFESDTG